MPGKKNYIALGEETGGFAVAESVNVGFVGTYDKYTPEVDPIENKIQEQRGQEAEVQGDGEMERVGATWKRTLSFPTYVEFGGNRGKFGTLLRHLFGKVQSDETTEGVSSYAHKFVPVADPYHEDNLGDKALTLNVNAMEGNTLVNYPLKGGRIEGASFDWDSPNELKSSFELFGVDTTVAGDAILAPVYPPSNLKCKHSGLSVWAGTITRVGVAPYYYLYTFASAKLVKLEKFSIKISTGRKNEWQGNKLPFPSNPTCGKFEIKFEITVCYFDYTDQFDSVEEFKQWLVGISYQSFHVEFDTGAQAGAGENYLLAFDLPRCKREGGAPQFVDGENTKITLSYTAEFDATAGYKIACLLKTNDPTI